ncbi:EamA family transporter [Mangrovicoccus ximenensis]|uniref:EamA family transporter n=1 Tax=Mangrovicoccus ximenensis TaxID=1911570 RepID=UPI001F1D06BD|nr:EamA family transporter [Mangrovicoccus ximenensis]
MTLPPKTAAAAATILWGFTYILTTTMLPANPWFIAAVRAIGGGLPLLLLARDLPPPGWWGKLVILGTLNNGLFFGLLFVAAIRLPGGVAATFQALGPGRRWPSPPDSRPRAMRSRGTAPSGKAGGR